MDKRSLKIFIACALGVGIGSLVALEMQTSFWWIGLLVGGLLSYLPYPWKNMMLFCLGRILWAISILLPLFLLSIIMDNWLIFGVALSVFAIFGFIFFIARIFVIYEGFDGEENTKAFTSFIKNVNPVTVYFYHLPRWMRKLFSLQWKYFPSCWLACLSIVSSLVVFLILFAWKLNSFKYIFEWTVATFVLGTIWALFTLWPESEPDFEERDMEEEAKEGMVLAKKYNPFSFYLYYLPKSIVMVIYGLFCW